MQETLELTKAGLLTIGLGFLSWEDIKTHTLPGFGLLLLALSGAALSFLGGACGLSALTAFIPGILTLFAAKATRESIGYGDGLLILALGCFYTTGELMSLCLASVTLAGLAALVLLLFFHRGRKTRLPFVPFVFAAQLLLCAVNIREASGI